MFVNKVILIGNLTRDPELKSIPSGQKVCTFSLATNEVYYDAQKQKKEKVEFHNIVVWGKQAENVAQYMKKGSGIYIEGKLQTRSWDDKDSGKKLYRTEIMAIVVQFGAKPKGATETRSEKEDRGVDTDEVETGGYDGDLGEMNPEDIPF